MGFLGNLDKVNTLELFLTDKGKELMLKENGLGLQDLISRFTLNDSDYDYRRTSNVWVNGISPVPDGSLLPFGTTQSLNNDGGILSLIGENNACRSCDGDGCIPLSGDCWFDMPDVRGNRGTTIINCYYVDIKARITGCTECQCLPAVFINKKGPVEVTDEGCPCPDGTISERCCEDEGGDGDTPTNPITQGICGPIPFSATKSSSPQQIINQSGVSTRKITNIDEDLYVPKLYNNFRSGLSDPDTGIGANLPPLDLKSKVHNYSSYYTIDFNITLQQYYVNNKLEWDVEFFSTSRYGERLLTEGDGSKFYWFVSSGYKGSQRNPKETKACITPTISTINLNKNKNQGINIAYLKGYWGQNPEETYLSYGNNSDITSEEAIMYYEFCVTMVYTYQSKLLKKTKRFGVSGNKYGYKLNVKS